MPVYDRPLLTDPQQDQLAPATGFLRHASVEERRALFEMSSPVQLRADEVLFQYGDVYQGFYAVVRGRMKLYRAGPAGRQLVLHMPRDGEVFGDVTLCMPPENHVQHIAASAVTASDLLLFPAATAAAFVRSRPHLYQALMERMGRLLEHVANHLEAVSLYGVRSRLARFFLLHARAYGGSGAPAVRLDMPKSMLAAHLGTVPETLSRTLRAFLDEGLIEEHRHEIRLLNVQRLRALAAGEEGEA